MLGVLEEDRPHSEIFIFLHIPKTGGQSIRDHFREHLEEFDTFIHLNGNNGEGRFLKAGLPPFQKWSEDRRSRVRVILGHHVRHDTARLVPGRIPRLITFLRDPAERIVSNYNFHQQRDYKNEPVSFDDWYASKRKNSVVSSIVRNFLGLQTSKISVERRFELADDALSKFWLVADTSDIDRLSGPLFRRIGVPDQMTRSNVAGLHFRRVLMLDDDLRERLHRDCPQDVAFYRKWYAQSRTFVDDFIAAEGDPDQGMIAAANPAPRSAK